MIIITWYDIIHVVSDCIKVIKINLYSFRFAFSFFLFLFLSSIQLLYNDNPKLQNPLISPLQCSPLMVVILSPPLKSISRLYIPLIVQFPNLFLDQKNIIAHVRLNRVVGVMVIIMPGGKCIMMYCFLTILSFSCSFLFSLFLSLSHWALSINCSDDFRVYVWKIPTEAEMEDEIFWYEKYNEEPDPCEIGKV